MVPVITTLTEMKLIGVRRIMSFTQNTTHELWKSFMPRRKEISNAVDGNLYSLQNYSEGFFEDFDPAAEFEKWAAFAVTDFSHVPEGMEAITLSGGLYAVFHYKGNPAEADGFFRAIFQEWLPQAGYTVDARPHFEVLGEKYKNGADDSEEEIWIPVKSSSHQVIKSSSHQVIKSSSHQVIKSSSHQVIKSSSHQVIKSSSHQVIKSSSHQVIKSSSHQVIKSSSHQVIKSSSHQVIKSSSHQVIKSSSHQVIKSKVIKSKVIKSKVIKSSSHKVESHKVVKQKVIK